jgi:shikimate dehydrogenase
MAGRPTITARTRLFCLIGDPVSHSRSPAMMNAAFGAAGIDAVYAALAVPADGLRAAVRGLVALGIGGVNVTAPHKGAVGALVDDLSPTAKKTRSVNTIVIEGGRAVGHSTDGAGLVGAIEDEIGTPISGAHVLMIGAGGAARGVLPALIEKGPKRIVIANRTEETSAALVRELGPGGSLSALPLVHAALAETLATSGILVNATALPVTTTGFLGLDLTVMRPGSLVLDMNYGADTGTLKARLAKKKIRHADGLPMLLHQGARSFFLWTKREAPLGAMRGALGL